MRFGAWRGEGEGLETLPVLPLRDLVVFPQMSVPLIVGRERSRAALTAGFRAGKRLLLVAQKQARTPDPSPEDLFEVGTVATIVQLLRLPDENLKVLVEGLGRARVQAYDEAGDHLRAQIEALASASVDPVEAAAIVRATKESFEQYAQLNKGLAPELQSSVAAIEDAGRLADLLATAVGLRLEDRQALLEQLSPVARLEKIQHHLQGEVEILQVERKIKTRVKKQMERSQREYYLNEQMQAIQKELGEKDEFKAELAELEAQIQGAPLSEEARERCQRELRKLRMMSPMSAEATVIRTWLDQVLALPWGRCTDENLDVRHAAQVLDEDHHGLEKVKERILEHLAVAGLVEELRGPVLCLVGPPGVGKTSLARSIARATGRDFVRQALGGVRDEAEIRGHRRTYIGALPGKILHGMKKAGSNNPVFLLDEVDKMSSDFRGDPAAALLEVLDPEQNRSFNDHYLELDYDLSRVMFVCTANSLEGIPIPLRDRLEIIRLPGYTEAEKLAIAQRYLIRRQREATGLQPGQIRFSRQAIERMIRQYTREAGVRNLEREIAQACRKVARQVVERGPEVAVQVTSQNLPLLLGVPRFVEPQAQRRDQVGTVRGLAVTSHGGEVLEIEVSAVPGKGKLTLTGLLGDWLKESATAGFSFVRSRAAALGLAEDFYEKVDVHVHYPGNAVKADGPSAGIAMATALVSALTGRPVRADVAMTGEISLRGRVLPIGGLKEKVLAAHRQGLAMVLLPEENAKDLPEIPAVVREEIALVRVQHMDEVLERALLAAGDEERAGSAEPEAEAEGEESSLSIGALLGRLDGSSEPH